MLVRFRELEKSTRSEKQTPVILFAAAETTYFAGRNLLELRISAQSGLNFIKMS
jgi:hypothetical protein